MRHRPSFRAYTLPSSEPLHRQGKYQAALLRGRRGGGGKGRGKKEGRKRTWVPETISLASVLRWLALGALGSRASLTLIASDHVNSWCQTREMLYICCGMR